MRWHDDTTNRFPSLLRKLAWMLVGALAGCAFQPTGIAVSRIIDGDSIVVSENEQIRLYGIDCPERDQPGGSVATAQLITLLGDRPVQFEAKDKDQYGRTVADVWSDEERVNAALVRTGNCWWYRKYAKKDEALRLAEATAKGQGLGVHADPERVPPWVWRRR